jgi:hypothetical protein
MDLSRSFLAAKKRSPKESAVVSAACCNALWTRDRLVRSGYELETNLCELCGLQVDTIHHRLYICTDPGAVEARNWIADKMNKDANGVWWPRNKVILGEAISNGELDPMYLHAVFPHPSDVQPGPALNTGAEFFRLKQPCPLPENADGEPHMAEEGKLYGTLFADGSCSRTSIRSLNRASWSVIETDDEGRATAGWMGAVPSDMPQTPQAGEYMAAAYAAQTASGETTLYDDCLNVVRDLNRDRSLWNDENRAYAAPAMKVAEWDEAEQMEVLKVKAHVKSSDLEGEELFLAKGNDAADHFAKAAMKLHPQPSAEAAALTEKVKETVLVVLQLMAAVLPLWTFGGDAINVLLKIR